MPGKATGLSGPFPASNFFVADGLLLVVRLRFLRPLRVPYCRLESKSPTCLKKGLFLQGNPPWGHAWLQCSRVSRATRPLKQDFAWLSGLPKKRHTCVHNLMIDIATCKPRKPFSRSLSDPSRVLRIRLKLLKQLRRTPLLQLRLFAQ